MSRLLSTIKVDLTIQLRNKLYTIGIVVGLLVAGALSQLVTPGQLLWVLPSLLLLVVGSTTLLYVAGMILFEKDERTLSAIIVTPLRTSEYLWSKILTLTGLAIVESMVMIGGAMLIMTFWNGQTGASTPPTLPPLLIGLVALCVLYTLLGLILIVRFDKITDFLMPMAAIVVPLQLPFLYFLGVVEAPLMLVIPTSAPTMLMQGAYRELAGWEWIYGLGYSTLLIAGSTVWAYHAFRKHILTER